ncbi:MAG: PD40 domain-containing protein [Acidobacteria bacterium]|nr:PD40 domain-containing protein [Acidobacteriota bacterium]
MYQFDDVQVQVEKFRVYKAGQVVSLEPKAFEVLLFLLENQGRLIEKNELLDAVWKDSFVTQNAMTRVIAQLRKALGDDPKEAKYIETVPTRGYRFVASVEILEAESSAPVLEPPTPNPQPPTPVSAPTPNPQPLTPVLSPPTPVSIPEPRPLTPDPFPSRLHVPLYFLFAGIGVLLLVAVIGWVTQKPAHSEWSERPQDRRDLAQLTTSTGLDIYPAVSPDGNSIAYSSDRSGKFEIYVRPLTPGGREIQVTNDGEQNLQPTWSPDGKMIAYFSQNRHGIYVVPALGGVAKQLTEFGSQPAWSPDGKTIAFQEDELSDLGPVALSSLPPSTLWTIPVHGGTPRQITQVGQPSGGHGSPCWSPDGKWIAFISYEFVYNLGDAGIWVVSPETGMLNRLSWNPHLTFNPIFSPDGKALYYVGMSSTKNLYLWKIEFNPETGKPNGKPFEVTNTGYSLIKYLSISPDGKRIYYTSLNMTNNLWSVPISPSTGEATGEPVALTNDTSFRKTLPAFSPDGKKIAYDVRVAGAKPDVWIMDADGKNQTQVTTDERNDSLLGWLPDNDQVVFISDREREIFFWVASTSRGLEKPIVQFRHPGGHGRLSPDGKSIAYDVPVDNAINIWVTSIGSGGERQITTGTGFMGFPAWSSDGKWLAFEIKDRGFCNIAIVPSEGGPVTQLTFEQGQNWPYTWSPDSSKIALAKYKDGFWNVWWISPTTREQKQITNFTKPNCYIRYPAWSPKGDQIVFEHAEITGNIWSMTVGE